MGEGGRVYPRRSHRYEGVDIFETKHSNMPLQLELISIYNTQTKINSQLHRFCIQSKSADCSTKEFAQRISLTSGDSFMLGICL